MQYEIKDVLHNRARTLLHMETAPGLGCTEPAAVGLAAAAAASLLPRRQVESVRVATDANIYKNAMGVILPGSEGRSGIPLAAALGALFGDPGRRLEVFADVDRHALAQAETLVREGRASAEIRPGTNGLYVHARVEGGGHAAEAEITGEHDHVRRLGLDGADVSPHPLLTPSRATDSGREELERWLTSLAVDDLCNLANQADRDDMEYIRGGLDLNRALTQHGLEHGPGLGVGRTMRALIHQGQLAGDMATSAGMWASAGIDARMGGVALPALTLAGSGNQGIAASVPLLAVEDFTALGEPEQLMRAIALSYLVTCYVKTLAGRLGALCGSAVASGAGVAAGVAFFLGGSAGAVGGAINNHIESSAALICDGAKTGCALKVGGAVSSAVRSALLALQGVAVRPADGIVDHRAEDTLRNLGRISRTGLRGMDPVVLDIMLHRCP